LGVVIDVENPVKLCQVEVRVPLIFPSFIKKTTPFISLLIVNGQSNASECDDVFIAGDNIHHIPTIFTITN